MVVGPTIRLRRRAVATFLAMPAGYSAAGLSVSTAS
jgi:hypothetical protein